MLRYPRFVKDPKLRLIILFFILRIKNRFSKKRKNKFRAVDQCCKAVKSFTYNGYVDMWVENNATRKKI